MACTPIFAFVGTPCVSLSLTGSLSPTSMRHFEEKESVRPMCAELAASVRKSASIGPVSTSWPAHDTSAELVVGEHGPSDISWLYVLVPHFPWATEDCNLQGILLRGHFVEQVTG